MERNDKILHALSDIEDDIARLHVTLDLHDLVMQEFESEAESGDELKSKMKRIGTLSAAIHERLYHEANNMRTACDTLYGAIAEGATA